MSSIIIRPISTEKALRLMETENKLVFEVEMKTNKQLIKAYLKKAYGVKIEKINTSITPKGKKLAIVKLGEGKSAVDLASELQLL